MLVVVCLSVFTPWWQLIIGKGTSFAVINANPFYTNFGVLGLNFVIPILLAINIATMALFTISGAMLIVYSLIPNRSYSKELLSYGYKRPIYTLVSFLVTLVVIAYVLPLIVNMIARGQVHFAVPLFQLLGTSIIQLPLNMFGGSGVSIQIGVTVIAVFQYTFYLAVVATALAIAARVYHRKIVANIVQGPSVASAPTAVPASTPMPASPSAQ